MSATRLSVIMPVFNAGRFLKKAVECILEQSYVDFEFVIIDDGSTDSSGAVLEEYAKRDSRIVLLQNRDNKGIAVTLNMALQKSKGELIVRFDADDTCVPERLELQLAFMEANPDIAVCGSWVLYTGELSMKWCPPTEPEMIRCALFFRNPMKHNAVIIRRTALEKSGGYNPAYLHAEDYELWVRMAKSYKLANLPQFLATQHFHPMQISNRHHQEQVAAANRVRIGQLHAMGMKPTPQEIEFHLALSRMTFEKTKSLLERAESWLQRLLRQNQISSYYDPAAFSWLIQERWEKVENKVKGAVR